MSSIAQKTSSVSSPTVPIATVGQPLPVVCVGCFVATHREPPQNCQLSPCPAHTTTCTAPMVATVQHICSTLVLLDAPASLINDLSAAVYRDLATLDVVLVLVWQWLHPTTNTPAVEVTQ